jgi:HlyD family secretion protein
MQDDVTPVPETVGLPSDEDGAEAGPPGRRRPAPRRRRSKRGKLWGAIAVVAAVLLVSGFLVYSALGKNKSATQYVTQQVTTGTLTVAVTGSGTTVSNSSTAVDPGVSGTVTQLDVRLGSQVKKGQILFVIDNPDLDASVQQAKAQYQQSQSSATKAAQQLSQARTGLTTSVQQAESQYLQAQSSTAKASQQKIAAKSELDALKARQASNPASVTASAIAIAQENYNAAVKSYESAVVSQQTAYTNYKQAQSIAQQNYDAALQSYNAAASSKQSAYMSYQQAVETADKRSVTAPASGYVTTLSVQNGDQLGGTSGSAKTTVASGSSTTGSTSTPIVITDLSDLVAQVQISETDRPNVKTGQKVEVTFDALPDVTITGKVSEIDAVGTNNQGVVTYGVTVVFDVQDSRLKPAMTASASIVTAVYTDVVLAPNAAIKTSSSGGKYVQVVATPNGTPQNVTVTTGAAGDSQTVITSGLKGGENVVTSTISSGSTATGTSSGRQGGFGGPGAGAFLGR